MWEDIIKNPNDPRYVFTLKEIQQQPDCWRKTAKIVLEDEALQKFLSALDINEPIIASGAGSSEFAAKSILERLSTVLHRRVLNAPTTDLVTNPEKFLIPNKPSLMISFARSGNSPESVAAVKLIKKLSPETKHLIITCNKDGELAKIKDNNTYSVILPEETNDESLVMTSSFSSMILAAVLCGYFTNKQYAYDSVEKAAVCASGIFGTITDKLDAVMSRADIQRVQYIGSSDAGGMLTEGHLKMLEMTDGQVATRIDSFLGLRHGPQVFVNKHTVVAAVLSSDKYVRRFEIDLLKELKAKNQGLAYVVMGQNPAQVELPDMITLDTGDLDDFFALLPDVVVVQLMGFFKSIALGLSPDAPSASGTINRVVQGVNIYDYDK